MHDPLFSGVCTALVTPFLNGRINFPMLEQLIRRQITSEIPAIVLAGTTGESSTLTDDEKIEIFRRGVFFSRKQSLIIAGTGSNSTEHSISLSISAESVGVDALLVVSPYYNKATADGLIAHYAAIAHAVRVPIILYNVPSRTGVDIPISVYQQLAQIPNIIGVKEASNDITKIERIKIACGPNFYIWAGNDDQIIPAIANGSSGVISVLSNILPEETVSMCNAALQSDFKTASALHRRFLPLIDLMFCEVNPIPVKAAMQKIGFDCGSCRLPLCSLSKENEQKMEQILSNYH